MLYWSPLNAWLIIYLLVKRNNLLILHLRIAHVLTLDCKFEDANKSILNASLLLSYMQNANLKPNCALFYTTCSMYMFSLSQYDKVSSYVVLNTCYCFILLI